MKMYAYHEIQPGDTIVHAWKDEDFEFSAHWHPQLEIVVVLSGNMQVQVNGSMYQMDPGDILLCGSNDIHSYLKSTGEILLILISPAFIEGRVKSSKISFDQSLCARSGFE